MILITLASLAAIAMPKPTSIMIAVGMPGHHGEQDEDSLNRERDDGDGNDDIATEAIVSIIHRLHDGKASAVRDVRLFADALAELCDAFMKHDRQRFEEAAHEAHDALSELINGRPIRNKSRNGASSAPSSKSQPGATRFEKSMRRLSENAIKRLQIMIWRRPNSETRIASSSSRNGRTTIHPSNKFTRNGRTGSAATQISLSVRASVA